MRMNSILRGGQLVEPHNCNRNRDSVPLIAVQHCPDVMNSSQSACQEVLHGHSRSAVPGIFHECAFVPTHCEICACKKHCDVYHAILRQFLSGRMLYHCHEQRSHTAVAQFVIVTYQNWASSTNTRSMVSFLSLKLPHNVFTSASLRSLSRFCIGQSALSASRSVPLPQITARFRQPRLMFRQICPFPSRGQLFRVSDARSGFAMRRKLPRTCPSNCPSN
jgi:hypothetical protein